jgi:hypothetical protein
MSCRTRRIEFSGIRKNMCEFSDVVTSGYGVGCVLMNCNISYSDVRVCCEACAQFLT